jgi:hypothetical protein
MRNRWIIALAGTISMACLGTVYSWSLFTQPLVASFGWSNTTTTWAFALAIFFLGVGAIIGGRWQDRVGPRRVAVVGAVLWGLGNLLAGLGTAALGPWWIYLSYGVIGGLGLGFGYITPVATVTKWFPDMRGVGSGMVVMGFGLGAFAYNLVLRSVPAFAAAAREAGEVLAQRKAGLAAALSPEAVDAVLGTFTASGLVFGVVGIGCAAAIRNPPASSPIPTSISTSTAGDWPPSLALRTPQFWALWAMLFLNVTAGILFISSAVPLLRELTGVPADRAVAALFALVLLCYGGGFGVMPSLVADWFGTRHLGVNYGYVLLAWSAAGLAGPGFVAWTKDHTGSYAGALPWIAGLLLAATLLPVAVRPPRAGVAVPAPVDAGAPRS